MEGSGFSGRMYSNTGVGMLGLEIPLNQQQQQQSQQQQQQQQSQQHHLQKHPHMVAFTNNHHKQHQQHEQQTQLSMKQPTNYLSSYNNPNSNPNTNPTQNQNQNPGLKIKTQMTHLTNSDEDEPGCANDHENSSVDDKRKGGTNVSPWHRMKWTDNMVRLLIMAVYYIGDEGGVEIGSDKKKPGSGGGGGGGGGGGLLQKKGKWKSVSRAMMEKGFYVSPQQCEDKFNDLNKRYKRVNDILGKGTACRVVENQTLLDSMDVTPKLKEEVRKLLNSKHLFFREMCAYHNSCGHGAGGHGSEPGAAAAAAVTLAEQPQQQHIQQNNTLLHHHQHHQMPMPKQQQQSCSHSATMSQSSMDPNSSHKLGLGLEDHDEDDDDDDEDDEDEYYEEDEEQDEGGQRKKAKTVVGDSSNNNSHALQKLNGEIMGMLQDGSKSSREKKQWMMTQLVQLEEQGLKFQFQALELEKQRWRWIKFSSKKEREMEKMKIDNERKRLETERMMLLLRQKEMEVLVEPSNPSCVSS